MALQELKSRLNSVKTTKKITKAMKLVATAKLQRTKKNLSNIQEYYSTVYEMFQDLMTNVKDVTKLFPKEPIKKNLYIIVTSDVGLCGGYNANVIKMLKSQFVPHHDKVIVIGNKGISALKTIDVHPFLKFDHIGDNPDYQVAMTVSRESLAQFLGNEVGAVKIIYTKFINAVTYEAITLPLLPMEQNKDEKKSTLIHSLTEFEPSPEEVIKNALPLYISALTYGAMMEAKVSEMISRRTAMENATDNADELINNLDLEYNRMRQSEITQEITEIIAGSSSE